MDRCLPATYDASLLPPSCYAVDAEPEVRVCECCGEREPLADSDWCADCERDYGAETMTTTTEGTDL